MRCVMEYPCKQCGKAFSRPKKWSLCRSCFNVRIVDSMAAMAVNVRDSSLQHNIIFTTTVPGCPRVHVNFVTHPIHPPHRWMFTLDPKWGTR